MILSNQVYSNSVTRYAEHAGRKPQAVLSLSAAIVIGRGVPFKFIFDTVSDPKGIISYNAGDITFVNEGLYFIVITGRYNVTQDQTFFRTRLARDITKINFQNNAEVINNAQILRIGTSMIGRFDEGEVANLELFYDTSAVDLQIQGVIQDIVEFAKMIITKLD